MMHWLSLAVGSVDGDLMTSSESPVVSNWNINDAMETQKVFVDEENIYESQT